MLDYKNLIGRVVYSKAGRDSERAFIISDVIDKNYVYIIDGNLRKVEKPKKKKIKHLSLTNYVVEDIKQLIMSGNNVNDAKVRKYLANRDANKEG
ncbi:KOW domain-containing RNA-binding protein [Clostridium ganghwense]|uniref:KOW domain-containing RNA-binding protein n=1 Tax=Clostridium ganghwense TaxID=312089 RepID=A0ABT4CU16_9CLOT|nr:KOW domain-containing RNA-binding protein [Clostridium ganghwense]MCY6371536.1 KOW domain-containing RNA-binding protein [Clostridium ganghwense]